MKNNILVILGHPNLESFNAGLAEQYVRGAKESGAEVRYVKLAEADFDPVLHKGMRAIQQLEPDLLSIQKDIEWANHLVLVFPIWWGQMPSLIKGFLERTFHSRWAFQYIAPLGPIPRWKKLLKGRSATCLITMGAPRWAWNLIMLRALYHQLNISLLGFCGFRPVRFKSFYKVDTSSDEKRKSMLDRAYKLGKKKA